MAVPRKTCKPSLTSLLGRRSAPAMRRGQHQVVCVHTRIEIVPNLGGPQWLLIGAVLFVERQIDEEATQKIVAEACAIVMEQTRS